MTFSQGAGRAPSPPSPPPSPQECAGERRRGDVRRAHLNGIDGVEVHDADNDAARRGGGVTLEVTFLGKAPRRLGPENIRIDGGRRVTGIRAIDVQIEREEDPDLDDVMFVTVDRTGDNSTYRLCVVEADAYGRPGTTPRRGFDPRYACADFVFHPDCPADQDCTTVEPAAPVAHPRPVIDYTVRDYASLRRLLLDRMTLTTPAWVERHVPDLGVTLVELLAYVGDQLSYQQDAVATEAYLDTARRRVSVRRHVRLIDYAMHDGCNARAWVALETAEETTLTTDDVRFAAIDVSQVDPRERPGLDAAVSYDDLLRLPPGARYEVFEPVVDEPVRLLPEHNVIRLWTWGDEECCLPAGATSATLRDEWEPRGRRLRLRPGDVIIIEEVIGPRTGAAADADPAHRQAVRLTSVTPVVDALYDQPVVEVTWSAQDALTFPVCVSARGGPDCGLLTDVSVVAGNVVLVDHGQDITFCDRPPEEAHVPPAPVIAPSCVPECGCADRPEEGPASAEIHRLLATARSGIPLTADDVAVLVPLVGRDALARARLAGDEPAADQAGALEALLAQLTYPPVRRPFRPVLRGAPVTQRAPFPDPRLVASAQAELLAAIPGRARARLTGLWHEIDHDRRDHHHDGDHHDGDHHDGDHGDHHDEDHHDRRERHDDRRLSGEVIVELRVLFGQAILDEVALTERPARALRELIARFEELLAAKLRRLDSLVRRASHGEVLGGGIGWEIARTWGNGYADSLDPADRRLAGPAATALAQDVRAALPAVRVAAYAGPLPGAEPVGTWLPRRDLLDAGPRDRCFVGELGDDGRLTLRFGDGVHGAEPPPGGRLAIRYRVGNGMAGNVGADAIDHLIVCHAASPVARHVTRVRNPLPAAGGTDPEPVDQVRNLAPLALRRTRRRAVTADDYAELAAGVAGVQRAAARIRWTGAGEEVHVAVDALGAATADAAVLANVEHALAAYRRIGHDLVVRPATLVPIDLELTVCVDPGYQRGHVLDALRGALGTRRLADGRLGFFHPDALTFGEPVRVSRLVAVAAAVPGVVSVQATRLRRLFRPENGELDEGLLRISPLEIAQLDNDPDRPENGRLRIVLGGGR